MSFKTALDQCKYKEESKEYNQIKCNLSRLSDIFENFSCGIKHKITSKELKAIHRMLGNLRELNFEFDIGVCDGINSNTLLKFLDGLNLDNYNGILIAQELFKKHFRDTEFNPISYGYGIKYISELII